MKFKQMTMGELNYSLTYTTDQKEYLSRIKDTESGFGFRLDGLGQIPYHTQPKGFHPELINSIIEKIALDEINESHDNLGLWYYCTIKRVEKLDD